MYHYREGLSFRKNWFRLHHQESTEPSTEETSNAKVSLAAASPLMAASSLNEQHDT